MTEQPGPRARRRAEVAAALLEAARAELARVGAAGLSLRAVARELNMAPSALFRYVDGRDELLTLLIVDAYERLGASVERAESEVERADLRGRWRAICASFRAWAREHPHEYALLYGSPVPHYHAPPERTGPAGTRVTDLLLAIGAQAPAPPDPEPMPGFPSVEQLAPVARAMGAQSLDARAATRGLLAWTTLTGAVSSELFEQAGEDIARLDGPFRAAVALGEWLLFGPDQGSTSTI